MIINLYQLNNKLLRITFYYTLNYTLYLYLYLKIIKSKKILLWFIYNIVVILAKRWA